MHLGALRRLGATIDLAHGYVDASAGQLAGAEITFDRKTVTGTENILMAATLARGRTTLRNCALEPEVADLASLLTAMGARIEGAGTDVITIEGVESLHGASHTILPDRIEAGTFIMAGVLAGEEVSVDSCRPEHLAAPIERLRGAGARLEVDGTSVRVRGGSALSGCDIITAPYPGFATDLQAQFMTVMTQARGPSVITEAIFENRFMHVGELKRMGADISHDGRRAVIKGPTPLAGAPVMATDLRASACLVLAGLVASGCTDLNRVYHIDRGYERIEEKLLALGADIQRVRS
jgi:UDP-N-acetylglucosamine 1-carboxyvinyltransferase